MGWHFPSSSTDHYRLACLPLPPQARTAPAQRLADQVAGKFTYGVMATAAATFLFWSGIGTRIFPQVRPQHVQRAQRAVA